VLTVIAHLICFAGSALANSQCDSFDVALTTTPAPPWSRATYVRHEEILSLRPSSPMDLVLIGDSLVQEWSVVRWQLAGRSVYNVGVSGDKTQHAIWRLQNLLPLRTRPQATVILIGTNNLASNDKPCAVVAGIEAVAKGAERAWPGIRIYIIEIPPRGLKWQFKDSERREINTLIELRARAEGWVPVNVDDEISCKYQQPCENYKADLLHLTEKGYIELTRIITERLP